MFAAYNNWLIGMIEKRRERRERREY